MSEHEIAGAAPAAADAVDTEISREAALERLLTDDSLADVTLRGTDGAEVSANRCLLAARSDVFRALLYGNFAEGNNSTISVGYKGYVLRAVVRYIYTDTYQPFSTTDEAFHPPPPDEPADMFIMGAANYFNLPGLGVLAVERVKSAMKIDPSMSFFNLSTAIQLKLPDVEEAALKCVRTRLPQIIKNPPEWILDTIKDLTPSLIERVLQDEEMQANEKSLFTLLKLWARDDGTIDDIGGISRKEIASDMVAHIRLDQIDPAALTELAANTGFVTDARLLEAYKSQALHMDSLMASSTNERVFNRKRKRDDGWEPGPGLLAEGARLSAPEGSDANTPNLPSYFDVTQMTTGSHKWRLKIHSLGDEYYDEYGVSFPKRVRDSDNCKGCWMLRTDGITKHGTNRLHTSAAFSVSSVLTFTLKFQEGGASLSVSVDGGDDVELFSDFAKGRPLLPSAKINEGAIVEILSMESED